MNKAERVLLILGIVITVVQFVDLVGDIIAPYPYPWSPESTGVIQRIIIYSIAGLLSLSVGIFIRRLRRLLGSSLAIGGVYLLLCACNGGLFTSAYPKVRLAVTGATLIILVVLALKAQTPAEDSTS
jgi:hypothetical protein